MNRKKCVLKSDQLSSQVKETKLAYTPESNKKLLSSKLYTVSRIPPLEFAAHNNKVMNDIKSFNQDADVLLQAKFGNGVLTTESKEKLTRNIWEKAFNNKNYVTPVLPLSSTEKKSKS